MSKKRCWHIGCAEKGMRCILPWPEDETDPPYERYCYQHAAEHGYCYGCGLFCSGIESFDFGPYRGLCDNCADEVRANDAWQYPTEDEFEMYDYYP